MFAAMKKLVGDHANKFVRDRNYLEAVLAAAALIAVADGQIEEQEEDALIKAVKANAVLSKAWEAREIAMMAQNMLDRAKGGRMGQAGLYSELDDVAKNPAMAEAVLLMALDVSESDGQIEPEEKVVLEKIATRLSLSLAKYI
jgi:tellurite resistance protein TerB